MTRSLADPQIKEYIASRGLDLLPSASPEEFAKQIASDQAAQEKLAKDAGLYRTISN